MLTDSNNSVDINRKNDSYSVLQYDSTSGGLNSKDSLKKKKH